MALKIVLTGGPSGGKTTIATTLARQMGNKTVVVPEAASMLFLGGFPRRTHPELIRHQQRAIYFLQKELEGLIATEHPQKAVICDRGSLDGVAFWPEGFPPFLQDLNTSLNEELSRYDWVIHLDTATSESYDTSNPVRTESHDVAVSLNQRIQQAWHTHPRRLIIPSRVNFLDKVDLTFEVVRGIMEGRSLDELNALLFDL